MLRKWVSTAVIIGLFAWQSLGFAATANVNIGVLDVQALMQKSPQVEKIKADLEKQFKSRQSALQSQAKELESKMDKLKRNGSVMSEAERQELQADLMKSRRNLEQAQQDLQNDANIAQNKAMEGFLPLNQTAT